MGLIRGTLFVGTGGLVNPSSKKQRVAKAQLREMKKQTKLMAGPPAQTQTVRIASLKGVVLSTEDALRCKVISDPSVRVIVTDQQHRQRATLVYPDGTRQAAWLNRTPTGAFWQYGVRHGSALRLTRKALAAVGEGA